MTLDNIPREDLIAMLKDMAWQTGGRVEFKGRVAFSYEVQEETAIRDVLYRNMPLYNTPEEAIDGLWERHYKKAWADPSPP